MNNIKKVINFGVSENQSKEEQSKVQLTNLFLIVMFGAVPFYFITFYIIDISILKKSWGFLFPLFIYPVGMVFSYKGEIILARHFLMIGFISGIFYFLLFLGDGVGVEMFFFVVIALSYLIKPQDSPYFSYIYLVICVLLLIIGYQDWSSFTIEIDSSIRTMLSVVMAPMAVILLFFMIKFFNDEINNHISEIDHQKQQLETLNEELNHFAYIASHNLNEPIRTMDSFIDIIKEEYHNPDDEAINIYFSFIQQSSERMHSMIDSLLAYSKLGQVTDFRRVDIYQMIELVEQDLGKLIEENKVNIHKTHLQKIECMPLELRQVFQNLISNAIKFQHPNVKPIIEISQQEHATHWRFCISDNGIGIKENKLKEVFQMFTKIHRSTEYNGSGIGLAFCKKIVELHYGKIWIESVLDKGSKVYFTISKELKNPAIENNK
ncbi:ATP-binding protein [Flammeovirga sp. SJP92]|uniref:sensor histidine kinase n=1 Tax=Flammeovirga sp. SJP92 TaxID=1775430 RepID=UPI0007877C70|nr:ATP-binding protein [Flammeovirga sp. SJP92]KXX70505.1 hypothetical protein AVL50_08390 [Flammeovirga sp. SJP92]